MHLAARRTADPVDLTIERHWASGSTILAAWHASYVRRSDRARSRQAGFLTAEIRAGRAIVSLTLGRAGRDGADGGTDREVRWQATSRSTWSATSTSRSCATPWTRSGGKCTRFDFKGVTVELTQAKDDITLVTDDEFRAPRVKDLIESKAVKRNLSLKIFDWGKIEPAGGNTVRQVIKLRGTLG